MSSSLVYWVMSTHWNVIWVQSFCFRDNIVHVSSIAPLCQTGEVTTGDPSTTTTGAISTITTSTTSTISTASTTALTHCPTVWSHFNEGCFWAVEQALDWLASEEGCQALHPAAHLASINSVAENDFVYSLYNNQGAVHQYIRLGGSDAYSEGDWTWNDGSSFDYNNWASVGDEGTSKNCLSIDVNWNKKKLYDRGCFDKNFFICEINLGWKKHVHACIILGSIYIPT